MNEAKAQLNNYRQSPRKVRVVADLIRGKKVEEALDILTYVPKRAGLPLKKLISSAYTNANKVSGLVVKEVKVDAGPTLYRNQPRSYRGGNSTIRKRTSHVTVILSESKAKSKKLETKS